MGKTGQRRIARSRPRNAPQRADVIDDAQDLRALCRALQFWRVCGKTPCRRALDCMGDAQACFRQFWWELPEEARVWVRAAIRASAGGLGRKAARQAADAEIARWQELQERYAPKTPMPASATQTEAATPEAAARPANLPRIRTL